MKNKYVFNSFDDILKALPIELVDRLNKLKTLEQRIDYHPEIFVFNHIKIVTERCIKTGDKDLIIAAVFHDMCKLETTILDETTGILHSLEHEDLGADLVWYYSDLITEYGANWRIVKELVAEHMAVKQFPKMNKNSQKRFYQMACFDKLMIFTRADDMLLSNQDFDDFLNGKDIPQRTH